MQVFAYRDDCAPFGETCAQRLVLGEPLAESVETLGHLFSVMEREFFRARVHFDARKNALLLKNRREGLAVVGFLTYRFVVENHTAYVLFEPVSSEQGLPVRAAVLLGAGHTARFKAFLARTRTFIGSKDSLPRRHHHFGCLLQEADIHSKIIAYA